MPPKIQKWLFSRFVVHTSDKWSKYICLKFSCHNDLLSDLQFTHWWFMCIFWNCCLFFLSRIFFPHILLTKMARKNGKFLSTIYFFQGCLSKLHHIIVKSYNKNKIQFLPFLHLIEKLFLCISLPLFLQYLIFYKCKYILLGLVVKFLLILLPITPLASMDKAIKNVLIIQRTH